MAARLKKPLKLNVTPVEESVIEDFSKFPVYTKALLIKEGIFLGDAENAKNAAELCEYGITHVINCCAARHPNYFPEKFTYLSLELKDKPEFDLSSYLFSAVEFIQKALDGGGKILIHCNRGISRGPSVLIAYYIWKYRIETEPCLEKLKLIYPKAEPNLGFLIQLNQFEKIVLDKLKRKEEFLVIEKGSGQMEIENC